MPVIRKILLDAYGTIFTPRAPLASQYAEIARSVGLKVEESAVKAGFKIAYNTWNASHPIYGKLADPPLDPRSWWANVIKDTFYHAGVAAPLLTQPLLSNLTASLIQRFWTQEGYSLHPDVLPFLTHLTQLGVNNGAAIGSGSEPDVVEILRDLHVISCMKAGDLEHVREDEVFTSWAVGCEKRKEEFWLGVLAKMNEHLEGSEPALRASEVLVIGDELIPDYETPRKAGFQSVLLRRRVFTGETARSSYYDDTVEEERGLDVVHDLLEVEERIRVSNSL